MAELATASPWAKLALLLVFAIVVVPLFTLFFGVVFGCLLALAEEWAPWDGILFTLGTVAGLATPLTNVAPESIVGACIIVLLSAWAIGVMGTIIGCVATVSYTQVVVSALEGRAPDRPPPTPLQLVRAFLGFTFAVVPAVLVGVGALFGVLMAAGEGWGARDGVLYVLSNLLGLGNPLTAVTPSSVPGQVLDVMLSLWSLALSSAALGLIGAFTLPSACVNAVEGWLYAAPIVAGRQLSLGLPGGAAAPLSSAADAGSAEPPPPPPGRDGGETGAAPGRGAPAMSA